MVYHADVIEFPIPQSFQLPLSSSIGFDLGNVQQSQNYGYPQNSLFGNTNQSDATGQLSHALSRNSSYSSFTSLSNDGFTSNSNEAPTPTITLDLSYRLSRSTPSLPLVRWVDQEVRAVSRHTTVIIGPVPSPLSLQSIVSPPYRPPRICLSNLHLSPPLIEVWRKDLAR
jgi:hypothetical protein